MEVDEGMQLSSEEERELAAQVAPSFSAEQRAALIGDLPIIGEVHANMNRLETSVRAYQDTVTRGGRDAAVQRAAAYSILADVSAWAAASEYLHQPAHGKYLDTVATLLAYYKRELEAE